MPADGRNRTPRDIVRGFAKLIKDRRLELEMSQHDLAARSGVGATSISNIEREWRAPSLRVAMKLARALKLNVRLTNPANQKKQKTRPKAKGESPPESATPALKA